MIGKNGSNYICIQTIFYILLEARLQLKGLVRRKKEEKNTVKRAALVIKLLHPKFCKTFASTSDSVENFVLINSFLGLKFTVL